MSRFFLSPDGIVGVYGDGDEVIGNAGNEKVYLMDSARHTVIASTIEEAHTTRDAGELRFSVDSTTNQVFVRSGDSVLAALRPDEAGIRLKTATGAVSIKAELDEGSGEVIFTASSGLPGAEAIDLAALGDAPLPDNTIDTSDRSDVAPAPTPQPPAENALTVQEAWDGLAAGTLAPGGFTVMDTAAHLRDAPYMVIANAGGVVLRDSVDALVRADGTPSSAAEAALGMAGSVVVADALPRLIGADLPDFGKPTTVLVTGKVNPRLNLDGVTVAVAADAQKELDTFLARTDVFYEAEKPASLTIASYSIRDSVANIAGADRALLDGAGAVAIADTMAAVAGASLSQLGKAGSVVVEDSLANMAEAKVSTSFLQALLDANASFTATDDPGAGGTLSADAFGLQSFGLVNGASIALGKGVTTVNLFATSAVGANAPLSLDMFDGFTGTLNFTGSDGDDIVTVSALSGVTVGVIDGGEGDNTITVTADGKAARINGGSGNDTVTLNYAAGNATATTINGKGGADVITLGAGGRETVVLGDEVLHGQSGTLTLDDSSGDFDITSSTATWVKNFAADGTDTIAFSGDLAKFIVGGKGDVARYNPNQAVITTGKINIAQSGGSVLRIDSAADLKKHFLDSRIAFLKANDEAILVTSSYDDDAKNLWYLKGGADETSAADDTLVLLGTVEGDGNKVPALTADFFTAV